jgi:hypothetical protein
VKTWAINFKKKGVVYDTLYFCTDNIQKVIDLLRKEYHIECEKGPRDMLWALLDEKEDREMEGYTIYVRAL